MNLAKHDPETDMELNMTSMIDVVFLLIIFFMIITDLTQQDLEDIQLPVAVHAAPDKPDPNKWRPILNIDYKGQMVVRKNVKYDPELDREAQDPYKQMKIWLTDASARMDKEHFTETGEGLCGCGRIPNEHKPGNGDPIPGDFLLIRADQSTSFREIQKIMEFCGETNVSIWKIQLAAAEPKEEE
jgi:biopolymer transport protein ExbD